jgi:multidrug efflux pump subunit AcrA (membrane-fusion protein)
MLTRYVLPLIALATLTFAILQMTKAGQKPPAATPPVEPARSPFTRQLAGAGIVEPDTENLSLGTQLSGIVEQVHVKVGDTVRPGQPLFRLDERATRAELDVRLANLGNMQAMLDKLEHAPRLEEVPPYEAKVAEAEANVEDQRRMYDRLKRLTAEATSDDELSRREMGVAIAKAQLAKSKGDLALLKAGSWSYDKLVAGASVKQASAQVEQTRTELARLTVKAPRLIWDGPAEKDATEYKVLQVNVRPGEYVSAMAGQALIVLGHVGQLHVRVDIDENDIPRFRPNLPGFAQPRGNETTRFAIHFVRVEPYVIPKRQLTGASTERVDTRVLQVIYAIEPTNQPLYVGQQMDVFLNAGSE